MIKIIQDFRNYRNANEYKKCVACELQQQFDYMLQRNTSLEYQKDKAQNALFIADVSSLQKSMDSADLIEQYMKEKAALYHASSCFFVNADVLNQWKKYNEAEVERCVHNHEDGSIFKVACKKCSEHKLRNLFRYHSLKEQLQDAEKAEKEAKQKLINRLKFWKQKGK